MPLWISKVQCDTRTGALWALHSSLPHFLQGTAHSCELKNKNMEKREREREREREPSPHTSTEEDRDREVEKVTEEVKGLKVGEKREELEKKKKAMDVFLTKEEGDKSGETKKVVSFGR